MEEHNPPHFEDLPPLDYIGYEIHHADIVAGDTQPFLEFWDVERIANAGRLNGMFNKVMFAVGGYDNDKRVMFEIPEIRAFLKKLAGEWPYFFYADNLQTDFLIGLLQCMLPSLRVSVTDNSPRTYKSSLNVKALNEEYQKLLFGLQKICELDPQMDQMKFDARVDAIQSRVTKGFQK